MTCMRGSKKKGVGHSNEKHPQCGVVGAWSLDYFRRKSSASFTNRHSGTERPRATFSATAMLGVRSHRSISEIILEDRDDFSANDSCVSLFILR